MAKTRNMILGGMAALLSMSAGFWLATTTKNPSQQQDDTTSVAEQVQGFHGTRLATPRKLGVPVLSKHDNTAFTAGDLQGHWSLLFFGYTNCPDICPTTMNMLVAAKQKSTEQFPKVYFISVDPQRDSLSQLASYVDYFDKDFVGVSGDEKMLNALAIQASVLFMKMPSEAGSDNEYLVDHSSALLLVNPEGKLTAFINPPHTPESILKALAAVALP